MKINLMKKVGEGKLEFIDDFGETEFSYTRPEKNDGNAYHQIRETIPENIVKQGEKAIIKYANKKIGKAEEKWKKHESIEENIMKNNISIQTKYKDGTLLKGRIVKATTTEIYVELDKPIKGKSSMHFGVYAHMAGQHIFTKEHEISQHGHEGARDALCNAYRESKNKPKRDLVERLNKKI